MHICRFSCISQFPDLELCAIYKQFKSAIKAPRQAGNPPREEGHTRQHDGIRRPMICQEDRNPFALENRPPLPQTGTGLHRNPISGIRISKRIFRRHCAGATGRTHPNARTGSRRQAAGSRQQASKAQRLQADTSQGDLRKRSHSDTGHGIHAGKPACACVEVTSNRLPLPGILIETGPNSTADCTHTTTDAQALHGRHGPLAAQDARRPRCLQGRPLATEQHRQPLPPWQATGHGPLPHTFRNLHCAHRRPARP